MNAGLAVDPSDPTGAPSRRTSNAAAAGCAAHVSDTESPSLPATARPVGGASGGGTPVVAACRGGDDAPLLPSADVAATEKLYEVPDARPVALSAVPVVELVAASFTNRSYLWVGKRWGAGSTNKR